MAGAAHRQGTRGELPSWLTKALSREQQRPLLRPSRNACLFAGAGSGKTRTLVHMIAHDLEKGTPSSAIAAFTFTEKAAEEMTARLHVLVERHLPETSLAGVFLGTIHSWCFTYLTAQPDFYNFTPLDDLHMDTLVSRLYDDLGLEQAYGLPFPKGVVPFLADLEVLYNENLSLNDVPKKVKPTIAKFLQVLDRNRLLTFGGMIRHTTEHLRQHGAVCELQVLYVDEYQDVNPAQVELIKAMLPDTAQCVVVGDDLQCIYNWRGSDIRRILKFEQEFPESTVYRLVENYRSRPTIVSLANRIADEVKFRDPKIMRAVRDDAEVPAAYWVSLHSEREQAQAVVSIVQSFTSRNVRPNQIAVLLRSVVGSGKPIVDALAKDGIPFQCAILGRGEAFVREFLLPVFAWLRAEHREPRNEDEEKKQMQHREELWNSVAKWVGGPKPEDTFWTSIDRWYQLIEQQVNEAYDVRGRLYELLNSCQVHVGPQDNELMLGLGIASQVIRTVEEIHRRRFTGISRRSPHGVISEAYYALLRNYEEYGESMPVAAELNGVVVTTIHQAKGIEWPIVIIPMLAARRFPVASRKHATSFGPDIAARYGTTLEDERRLFYVACTRAKERLFLLDPSSGKGEGARSEFLNNLEEKGVLQPKLLSKTPPGVWRIQEGDLKERDPPPLQIGLSDLLIYLECPYQFGLRHVVGVQPSVGEELGFGKSLHELIQRRHDSAIPWSNAELRRQAAMYVSMPYTSEEGEAQSRRAIENRIRILEKLGAFKGAGAAEIPFNVLLRGGIVSGNADCVLIGEGNTASIREWKSSIHLRFLPRYERQLKFYAYALRKQGKTVKKAEMVDVSASVENGRLVSRTVDIGGKTLSELVMEMQRAIEGIKSGTFSATPNPESCSACDVYAVCKVRWDLETSDKT